MVIGKETVPGGSTLLMLPEKLVFSASHIGLLLSSLRTAKAVSVSAEGEMFARLTARQRIEMVAISLVSPLGFLVATPSTGAGAASVAGAGAGAPAGARPYRLRNASASAVLAVEGEG